MRDSVGAVFDEWSALLRVAGGRSVLPDRGDVGPLTARYAPFLRPMDRPVVLAHLAQSLDGRIALPCGQSQWISGQEDLVHTHRLRALADAVVVGAHTVERDDPQLTTRLVTGPNPLRVVLDPRRRLRPDHQVFDTAAAPTLLVGAVEAPAPDGVETLLLPATDGVLDPASIVAALGARGVRRILVEGGGITVSRFLAAGCVDRLHLVVAPVLMGHGRPALDVPLASALADCPRPPTRVEALGEDWLFDCELR